MTRSATALSLYVVWFALAFGLRTMLQLLRTGSSGFKGVSGQLFSWEWTAGVLFVVALVLGVLAPIAGMVGWGDPLLDTSGARIGGVTAVLGVVLTLAAQVSMGDSWRIGVDRAERTALVTAGAFAVCRNPIFSAMVVTAFGLMLLVGTALAFVGFAALMIALELQVRIVEEPYLLEVHPAEYDAYAARVGRFVPLFGRIKNREDLPASL